jgi:hypothetical protein
VSLHELTHRERFDGRIVPACTCGWWSPDGSHWRFEKHLAAATPKEDDRAQ